MLFLFRGHNGPVVRAIVGALLLAAGIAIHGGAILAGIGRGPAGLGRDRGAQFPAGPPPGAKAAATRQSVVSVIVADRLTKHFGEFAAVNGVSFEVPGGTARRRAGTERGGQDHDLGDARRLPRPH